MEKKEVIAYAITHAPPGVKGGPYDSVGGKCRDLAMALKWTKRGARARLGDVLGGRVIRIVRKARPSEASAVEVLRSFIAWVDCNDGEEEAPLRPIEEAARRVLAAAGPDPSEVVRAAMVDGWTFDDEKPVSAQRGSVAVLANDDEVFVERDCGRVVTIPRAVIVELLRRTSAGETGGTP
jgi:hypothetical protein